MTLKADPTQRSCKSAYHNGCPYMPFRNASLCIKHYQITPATPFFGWRCRLRPPRPGVHSQQPIMVLHASV